MAIALNKIIPRDSGNIINTSTNYSELNTKASGLVGDIIGHVEAELGSVETQVNADLVTIDSRLNQLATSSTAVYSTQEVDGKIVLATDGAYAQHGLIPNDGVNEIRPQDMFMEVNVADTLVDKKGYPVRFTDGVYDRLGENSKSIDYPNGISSGTVPDFVFEYRVGFYYIISITSKGNLDGCKHCVIDVR